MYLSTLTVLSSCFCSGCHLTTYSSLQKILGSNLMLLCSVWYFSLFWTSRSRKPISSLMIKSNRSSSSLSNLWHLCKFPNIFEMKPLIRKGEFEAQASLITDIILMAQNVVCVIETYSPFRKQLLTLYPFSISKKWK